MHETSRMKQTGTWLTLLLFLLFSACTYRDRIAPIQLPTAADSISVDGLLLSATAFVEPDSAKQAFGFDARAAGLLPVQLTFQNDSPHEVRVNPGQTFLIDQQNNAWPILSQEKTYQRAKKYVDIGETAKGAAKPALLMGAAGAIAGAAK